MDKTLLTSAEFWNDLSSAVPGVPELAGHVLFKTSGSTGVPRSVAISKQALLVSAAAVNDHLGVTRSSSWGLVLPLYHVGGFGVVARAYEAGSQIHEFGIRWVPHLFCEWIETNKISHTSLVPTQVYDLVKENLKAPDVLRAIVVGGGHLDPILGQAARDLGWPVLASYGMTEASSQIATQGLDSLQRPYQSERIPILPIWDVKASEDDLLSISGAALFSGYVSGEIFTPLGSLWFQTSDRVSLVNREIKLLGRADSQVKIFGELVDLEAIERELVQLSQGDFMANHFAVVAIPDERAGSLLVPVFESHVRRDNVKSVLLSYEKKAFGFQRLQPAVFVEKLPRSVLGKLRRDELVTICRAGIIRLP